MSNKAPYLTGVTLEAGGGGVPVLPLVRHLTLVHTDVFPARVAELGEQVLKAAAAVRSTVAHDVALTAQLVVALHAAEVMHVPASPFSLCALVSENYLPSGETHTHRFSSVC